ncbi:MAG: UpxY family transcription antiterminator [Bacteroidaceae bacterium]
MEKECDATSHWYALKVYFNKVSDMEDVLKSEGIESYVPRMTKPGCSGTGTNNSEPAITSLMFFRSSQAYAGKLQEAVRGKAMVYTRRSETGWVPAAISDREMNVFRLVVSSGEDGLEYFSEDSRIFRKGMHVRVTGGPFRGAEGCIVRIKGNRRLIVSIHGVCAVATSYIPQCFLEKVEEE